MDQREERLVRNTTIFVCLFLLAGFLHLFENIKGAFFLSTLMFCTVTMIYLGLVMFWTISIRYRLLPNRERTYTLLAAGFMLMMILIRTIKYRYCSSSAADRLLWYASYLPIILIPGLFALTASETAPEKHKRIHQPILWFILSLLILLVFTNDLTEWVWKPAGAMLTSKRSDYTYGWGIYVIYIGITFLYLYGLLITFKRALATHSLRAISSVIVLPLLYAFLQFSVPYMDSHHYPGLFEFYEVHVFGMMAIWENCIRLRLFPYNSQYETFFEGMKLPTLITDRDFVLHYQASWHYTINREQLKMALSGPVYPQPDIRLMGREIQAGYAFWIEDVSEINRLNHQLEEIHETLETENDLIEAEQRLREKQDRIELRNRIYGIVAEELLPNQQKIRGQLNVLSTDDPKFREKIAYLAVEHAFVKRKSNLTLLAAEESEIDLRELELALDESGKYLSYLGIEVSLEAHGGSRISSFMALRLYDTFSMALDSLIGRISQLMITLSPVGIRLTCDLDEKIEIPEARVPVEIKLEEGLLFVRLIGEVIR
jgi:hypothetical protein